jgi:hypothetical protein
LAALAIPIDAAQRQADYLKQLDSEVLHVGDSAHFFSADKRYLHCEGSVRVDIEKVDLWNYRVVQSTGTITHILLEPNQPEKKIVTQFDKLPFPAYDYLTLKPMDLFGFTFQTQYRQLLPKNDLTQPIFTRTIIAATKVAIFPWPSVSNTIYFTSVGDGLVPIAYARLRSN